MSEESFDLFAPTKEEPVVVQEPAKVIPFVRPEPQASPASHDESCNGCFFMGWGKKLRRICRSVDHPGPIMQKAFCLDETGKLGRFVPFDGMAPGRMSYEEMAQNNLT